MSAPVPPWMADALCAQVDNEMFFPEKGGATHEAKSICARCPVAAECLTYALENNERFGIWGGLSERERRRLRSSNAAPPLPACALGGCNQTVPTRNARYCSEDHRRKAKNERLRRTAA